MTYMEKLKQRLEEMHERGERIHFDFGDGFWMMEPEARAKYLLEFIDNLPDILAESTEAPPIDSDFPKTRFDAPFEETK